MTGVVVGKFLLAISLRRLQSMPHLTAAQIDSYSRPKRQAIVPALN